MRLKLSFTVIFSLLQGLAIAQEFTPTRHAIIADSTGRAGNVDQAIVEWKLDYSISLRSDVAYTLATLYAIKEQPDSAFEWLSLALEKDSTITALVEGDFIYLSSLPEWVTIEAQQIAKSEARQGKYKNLELSRRLWQLQMKDQAYTTQWSQSRRRLGQDHPVTKALNVLIKKVRGESSVEAVEIIDQYGWPRISEVGEPAATTVFYIIQHGEAALRKKYLPYLKASCETKEAPWLWYATMYDRILNDEGKKQCYGTQFKAGLILERKPIEAPEYVNKRRRILGLEPLTEYIVPQKD